MAIEGVLLRALQFGIDAGSEFGVEASFTEAELNSMAQYLSKNIDGTWEEYYRLVNDDAA